MTNLNIIGVNTTYDYPTILGGKTSLRAAIAEAATLPGDDLIQVPAGPYALSLGTTLDINNTQGKVIIMGEGGANGVTILGQGKASVFTVEPQCSAEFDELSIQGGNAFYGGGINNDGTIYLSHTTLSNNIAQQGGGICNSGTAIIESASSISGNQALHGGGIFNYASATVINSVISGNYGLDDGGGVLNGGHVIDTGPVASLDVEGSTISSNLVGVGNYLTGAPGGPSAYAYGGGIENNANMTISDNSTVYDNDTTGYGGGIFNDGSATISSCDVDANTAATGGGIYNGQVGIFHPTPFGASIQIGDGTGTLIRNNQATSGGGLYNDALSLAVLHSQSKAGIVFMDNSAATGGAIDNFGWASVGSSRDPLSGSVQNGQFQITYLYSFHDNTASNGGAIDNHLLLGVYNSQFFMNQVTGDGGAIRNEIGGIATVTNSLFKLNQATNGVGGAIENLNYNQGLAAYNVSYTLDVTGCEFDLNSAEYGGAIANSGIALVDSSLFDTNSASADGGGIFNYYAPLTVRKSGFQYNSALVGGGIYSRGGSTSIVTTLFTANSPSNADIQ
jgi:hypothetical protein